MVTGVVMTERGVGKWLRRYGFSPQRPDRRSYRQDQAKVDAWLRDEYPAIAARAKTENAVVAWADQCGLRSDTAPPGTSWAPKSQTPIARVSSRRFKVNTMSAITSRGTLYFTVFTERFTAKTFTGFLDRLARQAGRKVHVIADRHPVHRSKAVTAWLKANTERIELHLMPDYSPEPNPDEPLNADIKRHIHAARAHSADDLAHETRRSHHQRQPTIVRSYIHAHHVRYTSNKATQQFRLNKTAPVTSMPSSRGWKRTADGSSGRGPGTRRAGTCRPPRSPAATARWPAGIGRQANCRRLGRVRHRRPGRAPCGWWPRQGRGVGR
ncbi:IS630 family transposase [Streptomyces noursei]|uniref:IS630 family transposase n=1 Tax=Streptomyces noursei TaxID=1971 RepID=UPI0035E3D0AE